MSAPRYVMPFRALTLDALAEVGGNASLGELLRALAPKGIRVPDGFALTAAAFRLHLAEAGLDQTIYDELERLDLSDVAALATAARSIRERVAAAPLPPAVAREVASAYAELSGAHGEQATDVAVRSSATAEDLPSASFAGQLRVVLSPAELPAFRPGEVLVARMTDPDWEPVLKQAAAVVTDEGGRTCHAAIVSRELGIPCVVGTGSRALTNGQLVTVSCAEGDDGKVYDGRIEFERQTIDPATLPTSRVPLMLNLANPERAFQLAQLPSAGVGLVRIEFVVSNWIGVHPMALLHPERIAEPAVRARIRELTADAASPVEFFIERLASGVAQIGRGVLSPARDRPLLGLQDQRVCQPPRRHRVRAHRSEPDDRVPRRLALLRRALPRGVRPRVRGDPAGAG